MARSEWYNSREFSRSALEVLQAAERLASTGGAAVGARHVACVLFCEHSVGPRLAWSTRATDIRGLQAELKRHMTQANAVQDEEVKFIQSTKAQRPNFGPKDIEDMMLALFEPEFELLPIFEGNGLNTEEMHASLPKALKAVRLYERQLADNVDSKSSKQALKLPASKSHQRLGTSPPSNSKGDVAGITASKLAKQLEHAESADERSTVLSSFGVDLVELARQGRLDPVIGRDAEISRVLQILARRTKNNVCLVGAPGVGKTAIAEAVAQRIAEGRVPPQMDKCKELWSLDIGALLAGTGLRGDFEERLRAILAVLRSSEGSALLFIDELHLVLGAGRSESNNIDAANLMKPMLARGEIHCIGATTSDEYRRLILEKDAAFERRFQPIELLEPSLAVAEEMLLGLADLYGKHHGVSIVPLAVTAAVKLSAQHIKGRSLPDKAIDVLDEACCLASSQGERSVEQLHVQAVVKDWRAPPWEREVGPLHRGLSWIQQRWSRL